MKRTFLLFALLLLFLTPLLLLINPAAASGTQLPCAGEDNEISEEELSAAVCAYMLGDESYSLDDIGDAAFVYVFWEGRPKTLTDMSDRQVTFYRPVERIITTNPDNSRIVIALGDLEKMVSTDEATRGSSVLPKDEEGNKLAPEAWEALQIYGGGQLDELPETNTRREIDYETMALLKPDVVFDSLGYNRGDLVEEKVGCPCVDAETGFTFEENYVQIRLLGEVLDREAEAEDLENFIQSKVDMVKSVTDQLDDSEIPTVYFAPRGAKKGFYDSVEGRDFTRTEAVYEPLTIAGGNNLAKDCTGENINVAPEQIVAWAPEYIFVAWSSWDNQTGKDFVMETPELSEIPAVKNGNVYDCFYPHARGRPLDRSLLNMMYMAKCLHPEEFKDLDLEMEGNDIYKKLLGVDGVFTAIADYQEFPKDVY
ncbi:TPA: iron ABC transporter substrate-binding protein [Methanosarcina acetivorans]|uniref:Iron ABC transporter, solute-binding protein n=2 Tax=Methanosarcina acetivorans TaxID=2214 RepID=Q8TKF6_METAC|nr:iron ABC transporter substrate-binding protein [Methanosarcina acetivorans]AAM06818.1 iron ABC transporter, solute-binding protein [Methanosarcina acetivorans C2A]HIH93467.1 iron ABC transporter substrate-binding protein [Methanosarcina acetivorans]